MFGKSRDETRILLILSQFGTPYTTVFLVSHVPKFRGVLSPIVLAGGQPCKLLGRQEVMAPGPSIVRGVFIVS